MSLHSRKREMADVFIADSILDIHFICKTAETAAELVRGSRETDSAKNVGAVADAAQTTSEAGQAPGEDEPESFTGRLASLLPGHASGDANGEPRTSRVIATGLISVASIASFKRHLSRVTGVQNVSVSSGPDGEFVFSVTHRPDVSFRDVIPSLPGFAARVTSVEDDVIRVAAQDPEAQT